MNLMNQALTIELTLELDKTSRLENYERWERQERVYNCSQTIFQKESKSIFSILKNSLRSIVLRQKLLRTKASIIKQSKI